MRKLVSKVNTHFHNMKIVNKLCILYMLILLPSLLIVNNIDKKIYERELRTTATALFEQIADAVDGTMEGVVTKLSVFTKGPLYSYELQQELASNTPLSTASESLLSFSAEAMGSLNYSEYIVSLYNLNGKIAFYIAGNKGADIIRSYADEWIQTATESKGHYCMQALLNVPDYACVGLRLIKSTTNFENVAVSAICVAKSIFEDNCERISIIPGSILVVTDNYHNIIYSSEENLEYEKIPPFLTKYMDEDNPDTEIEFNTGEYIGFYRNNNPLEYHVLIYSKFDELIASQTTASRIMTVYAIMIGFVAMFSTVLMVKGITRPLNKISGLMNQVRNGDYSVRFHPNYNDEVGILGQSFNAMLDRIDEMTEHIVAVNTSKKQMEIDALQSQINPHFTYNTLEKFRMMAVEADNYELADKIATFGKMLRYNITTINESTTINEELSFIRNYIYLFNNGIRHQISLNISANKQVLKARMIKLLIQPLVENAVYHGLELQTNTRPEISIKIYKENAILYIVINDNGTGIPETKLHQLQKDIDLSYEGVSEHSHLGIRNVNARIKLFYGDQYGITINSKEGQGTEVLLVLPYLTD